MAQSMSRPFVEKALACAKYYRRYKEKQLRHEEAASCRLCKPVTGDLEPFKNGLEKATQSIETLFHALGADSVKDQEEFVHFFKDKEKYPS